MTYSAFLVCVLSAVAATACGAPTTLVAINIAAEHSTAEILEVQITSVIENELNTLKGVERIVSSTSNNRILFEVYFKTTPGIEQAQSIQLILENLRPRLPKLAQRIVVERRAKSILVSE